MIDDTHVPLKYKPFPSGLLPEPLKGFVRTAARALGCDQAFVALPLLSAVAGVIGNTRRIALKRGWSEPAIIWTATMGESGSVKSPAFDCAMKYVRDIQHREFVRHDEAMQLHEPDQLAYERDLQAWKRSKASDPPVKPEPPKAKRLLCSDVTVEGVAVLLSDNEYGLLLARDELAGWIGSFDRYSQGRGGDAPQWLSMWSGGQMNIDRKTGDRRTIYVPRAAVSIAGTIQPDALRRVLGTEHLENGLAARLLLAQPPRTIKRWTETEIPEQLDREMATLFDRLYGLRGVGDAIAPILIPLSPDAKAIFVRFCNSHAQEQVTKTGCLASVWSKLEAYCARFALVYHCVRMVCNDATLKDHEVIDAESVACALQHVQWVGEQAERVYATIHEASEQREIRRKVEMIQAHDGGKITVSRYSRTSRRFQDNPKLARDELRDLEFLGYGKLVSTKPGPQGGRPSEVFILHEAYGGVAETTSDGSESRVSATSTVEPKPCE